jgi:hypothetical protein
MKPLAELPYLEQLRSIGGARSVVLQNPNLYHVGSQVQPESFVHSGSTVVSKQNGSSLPSISKHQQALSTGSFSALRVPTKTLANTRNAVAAM